MGEFNSDDHYIYYCGQEPLRRNAVALIVNKRVQNAVLGYNLKNNRMVSVCFHGKPFNITVTQVYAPTTNTKELKLNGSMKIYKTSRTNTKKKKKKKDVLFMIGDWNGKVGSHELPGVSGRFGLGIQT